MQNRYVGDIGDFGKYGLLRVLCSGSPVLKLGVVWYLFNPSNESPADGGKIKYLSPSEQNERMFAGCDRDLYMRLQSLVKDGERNVYAVREYNILPATTVFYEEELTFEPSPHLTMSQREERRKQWLRDAVNITQGSDVVFLDPDNGLQVKSTGPYSRRGPKYVSIEEVERYIEQQQSVVIYQHVSRRGPAEEQVHERFTQLRKELTVQRAFALYYKRGTARVFFVLPSQKHSNILCMRVAGLVQGRWKPHFELIKGFGCAWPAAAR